MSKEKDTQQILLQEDFLANHSALQESEKEQQMIATSGMKCLESLGKSNQDGLLEKMLRVLLTSTMAWYSDRCKLIWKTRVSKANVLLFQLQASVRGINENECGLLPTPNTMDYIDRKGMRPSRAATNRKTGYLSEMITMYPTPTRGMYKQDVKDNGEYARNIKKKGHQIMLPAFMKLYPTPTQDSASERTKKYKQGGTPLTVAVKMYPTPTAGCVEGGEQSSRVEMTESGGFILRKKNKPNNTFGAKLSDAMLYLEKQKKPGGKLNPEFVEFLMGYPQHWTRIEPTE